MDLKKLMSHRRLEVQAKSVSTAEITLYGDIGPSFWGDSITATQFDKIIKDLSPSINQINLRINSPGGDVFEGITMYNRLKQHKAKVTTYVDGIAGSIASIIALAGDEIVMGEGSMFFIHKPWTFAMGNAQELEETINRLDDVEEQLVGIYQRKTKLDRAEIKKMMAENTWLDAGQSLDKNFATKILEGSESLAIAASLKNAYWIKNKPDLPNPNELAKLEIDKILGKK
jgi:ATP-dependent Clp protease protease subunit